MRLWNPIININTLSLVLLFFLSTLGFSQSDSSITTLILIRHAEKMEDGSKNPQLSPLGYDRSLRLAELLQNANISSIYSTDFQRTTNTVKPIATVLSLSITTYNSFDAAFISSILSRHRGETVLLCGHSNTTPQLLNLLVKEEKYAPLKEDEYNKIFVVSITNKGEAKVLELSY